MKKFWKCVSVFLLLLVLSGCGKQTTELAEENLPGSEAAPLLLVEAEEGGNLITWGEKKDRYYEITELPFPTYWGGAAYGIVTPEQELYLVDGGFMEEDGERMRQYVEKHGGTVTGWILTHPHVDHIGAFLSYMESYSDTVETVYYSPFVEEFFYHEDPQVSAVLNNAILFSEFEKMKQETEDKVQYLPMEAGMVLDMDGMKLECVSSFEFERKDINANSLVFSLSANDFSMLFTGDMTEDTLKDMKKAYPADSVLWDVTVLQIPHHGYLAGIFNDELYRAASPDIALLDCTSEEYEKNSVGIQEHVKMIEALGIKVLKRFEGEEGNRIRIYD